MSQLDLEAWLERDPERWDAFVEAAPYRSFSQLWAWGELRAEGGWRPIRLALGSRGAAGSARIVAGAQLAVRRVPIVGYGFANVARGPAGDLDDDRTWEALMAAVGRLARRERIATVRFEAEAGVDSPVGPRLAAAPWRPAAAVQPVTTRILDLRLPEEELLGAMARKHRQYIAKAGRAGIAVEELDGSAPMDLVAQALTDFHQILVGTSERAGFDVRPLAYYRELWTRLAPANRVRLFFAHRDGERLATLFHLSCGDRVAELYGGSTPEGAEARANYAVKWEAIRALRAESMRSYDLWGIPTGGIAKFKEGFGGAVVHLAGAHDLVLDPAGDALVRSALAVRDGLASVRRNARALRRSAARSPQIQFPAVRKAQPEAGGVVREATEADASGWQSLLERLPSGDPLHDWEWATVAAIDGEPARRFVMEEEGDLVAIASAHVRRTLLGRSFWYVPRGPVLDYDDPAGSHRLAALIAGIRDVARAEHAVAVRLEPRVERASAAARLFDEVGLHRTGSTLQTPDTRLVDLLSDDEALLATLDKDTRYAIRRSAREGVTTQVIADPADDPALTELHAIVTETLRRAEYRLPSLERYRIIWRALAAEGRARIVQAHHAGRLESAALVVVEGDRSFYLYAGSVREAPGETKRFASYAVQWQMMRTAREMGARVHDLWGVAPENATPDHPWYGYSLFKKGFGGRFVSWAGSWDLVVDPFLYRVRDLATSARRVFGR
jgi:peptidoglycan pentaglycine glycine transferase (the first glycine)